MLAETDVILEYSHSLETEVQQQQELRESALFTSFLHKNHKAMIFLNETNPSLGPKVNLKSLSASYSQYLQIILCHGQKRGLHLH